MANADMAIEPCAPPLNPTTGGHLPFGCGDANWIDLRKQADGVVTNAAVLLNTYIKPIGAINIAGCSHIVIYAKVYKGTTPLTSISLIPYFSVNLTDSFINLAMLDWTADGEEVTISPNPFLFLFTATTTQKLIVMPNPGMNWLRFYTSSVGTDTASYAEIGVARGWGAMPFTKNPLG